MNAAEEAQRTENASDSRKNKGKLLSVKQE